MATTSDYPKDHWGIKEIAERYEISPQVAHQWTLRQDFPQPRDRLAMGPFWKIKVVEEWYDLHKGGRSGQNNS